MSAAGRGACSRPTGRAASAPGCAWSRWRSCPTASRSWASGPSSSWGAGVPRTDRANSTTYWLDRRTPGLSMLTADLSAHDYPVHIHEALLVAATEAGGSEIEAGGVPDEAHDQALLVVNPVEPHASRMRRSGGWRYRSFYLMDSALADVCGGLDIARFPSIQQGIIRSPDLVGGF